MRGGMILRLQEQFPARPSAFQQFVRFCRFRQRKGMINAEFERAAGNPVQHIAGACLDSLHAILPELKLAKAEKSVTAEKVEA